MLAFSYYWREFNDRRDGRTAWDVCVTLMERGVLAKDTHGTAIRLAPPDRAGAAGGAFPYRAVLHRHESVFRLGAGAEMDDRAATIAQFQMAGDEVGVEMGQEHVSDPAPQAGSVVGILLDVALRVDHRGLAAVADR